MNTNKLPRKTTDFFAYLETLSEEEREKVMENYKSPDDEKFILTIYNAVKQSEADMDVRKTQKRTGETKS
jgi:hypothetical protein